MSAQGTESGNLIGRLRRMLTGNSVPFLIKRAGGRFTQEHRFRSETRSMATVVPCASCYGSNRQPMGMFGRAHGGAYMSLLAYHGPRGPPPPSLAHHAPNMSLRQICHMLRLMRQIRHREAAAAAAARKQAAGSATPSSPSEKRCLPAFLRRRRTSNIKRVS